MYRPHQARETLILRMEKEIEEGRKEIREMRTVMGKMEGALKELEEDGREVGAGEGPRGEKSMIDENERKAATKSWEILDLDSNED
jgi:mediator of RNA polymerase II transcription subunit 7